MRVFQKAGSYLRTRYWRLAIFALALGVTIGACASGLSSETDMDLSVDSDALSVACHPSATPNPLGLPTACFDTDLRSAITNEVLVETPALHELFLIITALTPEGRADNTRFVVQGSDYANIVQQHFGDYASHEAVDAVQALLNKGTPHHIAAKVDASAYRMREDGIFEKRSEYTWIRGSQDHLESLVPSLQNFADDTDFSAFFRSRTSQQLYADQRRFFEEEAKIQRMLDWLNGQYPDTRPFESVRLIVSPLAFAYQHQDGVVDGNFRQLIAHINYPELQETTGALSPSANAFYRSSILFTELNHGFIEPRSSALLDRIEAVFEGGERFVDRSILSTSYGSGRRVFLEYLNWALISVYACERFGDADCQIIATRVSRTMSEERGFADFVAFQDWLLSIRKQNPEAKLQTLTPAMVDWFEQRKN